MVWFLEVGVGGGEEGGGTEEECEREKKER